MFFKFVLLLFISIPLVAREQWQSAIIYYNAEQRLEYLQDGEHNRIPDFSYAGYQNGLQDIPDIPVVKTISPVTGDNTAHINNALAEIASFQKDAQGFRGALLLQAGVYEIKGTIKIP